MSKSGSIVLKLGLVIFGILAGLLASELLLRALVKHSAGLEFNSIEDIRKTITAGDDRNGGALNSAEMDGLASVNLKEIIDPNPNDKIIYQLKSDLNIKFQRANLRTNSCGMRYGETPIEKPEHTYRIALLGDSFAFGWGVEGEQTFGARLESNLNSIVPNGSKQKFEVLNFAVPGYSTFQEVTGFIQSGSEFQPDAVLVFFVQNDFGLPFYVKDVYNPGGFLAATEFARLSWKAIDPKIEDQRLKLLGFDPNSALRKLANFCRSKGIKLYLAINPHKNWKSDFKRLPVLSKRSDINFIPMRKEYLHTIKARKIDEKNLTLSFDPHPSPLRHQIYGDILTPYFMESIDG